MSFITKDSGERQTFSTGMQRDSAAKDLRPDLLPVAMLNRWRDSNIVHGDYTPSSLRSRAFDYFIKWFSDAKSIDDCAAAVLELIAAYEEVIERPPMLVRWAELMGRGAQKYGERNWEKAATEEELARFKASAFRHFVQWFYGMNPEEDHAAAVFFNISGAEYVKARMIPNSVEACAAEGSGSK